MSSARTLTRLRRFILETAYTAQEGHIPSALSILDIVWAMYHDILSPAADYFSNSARDRFVLSKGQAGLAVYAVLVELKLLPEHTLDAYCDYASPFGGHPDSTQIPQIEVSSGSLGHGMPMAVGMALGQRIAQMGARTYVLIGDGEANEGSVWEAALLAAHHHLANLTCIVDYNHSTDRALLMGDMKAKFESFGWKTQTVDGHTHTALVRALQRHSRQQPMAIIAKTIKGKGIAEMENNPAWHHRAPSAEELPLLLKGVR